ncbi:MAG: ankyrin repeat domain-containing protein [Gammaproteobacteria bacterium]
MKKIKNFEAQDKNGDTLLITAAKRGAYCYVQLLLEGGADVNAVNNRGFSALEEAVWTKAFNEDVIKAIIKGRPDARAKQSALEILSARPTDSYNGKRRLESLKNKMAEVRSLLVGQPGAVSSPPPVVRRQLRGKESQVGGALRSELAPSGSASRVQLQSRLAFFQAPRHPLASSSSALRGNNPGPRST